jgi:SAM-dependent methyltransferase
MKTIYEDGGEYDRLGHHHHTDEEVTFYTAHALLGILNGKALELACGTGRLTVPLAKQGICITGIDNSPEMLTVAREKAAHEDVRIDFVEADMRSFLLGKRFDLIFLPNNSLAHLHQLSDIQSCFSSVLRHLTENGRFIIDTFNPSLSLLTRDPEADYPVADYTRPDGKTVSVTETVRYDPDTQISHALWRYRAESEPDVVRSLDLRMFFPQELDALLGLNGFAVEAKYGSFERTPFSRVSHQQIIVCRKAEPLKDNDA